MSTMWTFMASWFTSYSLFIFLNLTILIISLTSLMTSRRKPLQQEQHQQLVQAPSVLEQVTSFNPEPPVLSEYPNLLHSEPEHVKPDPPTQIARTPSLLERLKSISVLYRSDSSTSRKERLRLLGLATLVLFLCFAVTLFLLLDIVESRPFVSSRKDKYAVNPGVSTKSSYEVHQRLKASVEQHLRVFALEIVEGSDGGGEDDVSLQLEYQRSQETSASSCQEEPMLNLRGNRGASGKNEGGGEGGGRDGSRGNGSGRRGGGGGGGDGGGEGGGGGGGGDGEGGDEESRGGDKKKLRPTLDILKLAIMSIAITAQTSGSAIALKVGGLTFLTKLLLVFVMTSNLVGYLCSMISVLLMHTRPRVARVLGVTGCAATALGFLILIVTFIQGLYNGE